jgi:hypothetical protein
MPLMMAKSIYKLFISYQMHTCTSMKTYVELRITLGTLLQRTFGLAALGCAGAVFESAGDGAESGRTSGPQAHSAGN